MNGLPEWLDGEGVGGYFFLKMWKTNVQVFIYVVVLVFLNSRRDNCDPLLIEATGGFSFWRWNSPIHFAKTKARPFGQVLCFSVSISRANVQKKQRLCERKDRFIRWPIGAKWSNAKMPREKSTENHNIGMEWSWNMVQRVDTVYVLHKKKKCVSDGEPVGCHENNFPRESESLKRKTWSNDPLPLSDTEIWTST